MAQLKGREPEDISTIKNIVQPQISLAEQNARTSFNEVLRALSSTKDAGFQEFLRGSKIASFINDPKTFKGAEVSFRSTSAQDGEVSIYNIDVAFRQHGRDLTLSLSVVHNTASPDYSQMSITLFQPSKPAILAPNTEKPRVDLEIISRSQDGLHYREFDPHSVPRRVE